MYLDIVRSSDLDQAVPVYLKAIFAIYSPPDHGVNALLPELIPAIRDSREVPEVADRQRRSRKTQSGVTTA